MYSYILSATQVESIEEVKCVRGQKMDKMTSVTWQGNNRVVNTNNKTVTLFSFQTFIFDFFVFLKKKITVQI